MRIETLDKSIDAFLLALEKPTQAKAIRALDLLEEFGYRLGMPHSKKVGKELFELRIRGKQEVRIFYAFRKNNIILLHGFIKKSQKIPVKEFQTALQKLSLLDYL